MARRKRIEKRTEMRENREEFNEESF